MCLKKIVSNLIQKHVSTQMILHLAFSCNDKKKLKIAVWFTIKYMFSLYHSPNSDSKKILLMIKYDMSMLNGKKYVDQLLDIIKEELWRESYLHLITQVCYELKMSLFWCENELLCLVRKRFKIWCENVLIF